LTDKITERLRHEFKNQHREDQRLDVSMQQDVASKMQVEKIKGYIVSERPDSDGCSF
jgi:hypothetical protein